MGEIASIIKDFGGSEGSGGDVRRTSYTLPPRVMIFVVVSCPGLPCGIVFDPVGAIKERPFLGLFFPYTDSRRNGGALYCRCYLFAG